MVDKLREAEKKALVRLEERLETLREHIPSEPSDNENYDGNESGLTTKIATLKRLAREIENDAEAWGKARSALNEVLAARAQHRRGRKPV
jgi:hypothetical protein